jgi:putative type-1 restriction enzyme hindVIIP specificity protein
MAEWVECTIGDLCNTISDTYKGKDEYVVLINTSDVLEGKVMNHETVANKNLKGQFKKTFKKDDILYSEIRPANKRFAFVDFENTSNYIASTKLMVLRHNDTVLPEYLFALLKSNCVIDELQHLAETRSGTFPQITFSSELASMRVFLPDRETQKRIISVLSSIEKKIDKNLVINNNLPTHPCNARIAAKQRRQTPKTDECLHTDGKVSGRGDNEETAEQFSSILAA